jgi:hypothetical protein
VTTGALGPPPRDQPLSPKAFAAIMIAMSALFAALAVWGISTAFGLFRRRPWSRISILIFAGLLTFFAASGLLMMPFMQFPADPNVGARLMSIIRLSMFGFYAALTGIGVWWLILFNLRNSRRYFIGQADAPASGKPLSISLIAWYLLIAAALLPLAVILRVPALIFGVVFTQGAALAVYIAFAVVHLYLGVALLRLRETARIGAILYFGFVAVSGVVSALRVDPDEMMRQTQAAMPAFATTSTPAIPTPPWLIATLTIAYGAIPTYFLIRRRQAFLSPPAESQPS